MNEIKDILDDLKKTADNKVFVVCGSQGELDKMPRYTAKFLSINDRQAHILLDYITELEEENESYLRRLDEAYEREDIYISRIDKAIEYINAGKTFETINVGQVVNKIQNDLLEILQGDNKE